MPIYEFYCPDCHRVFRFLARRLGVDRVPACPACRRPELEREISLFSAPRGRSEGGDDAASPEADMPDVDETRLESAMQMLEREADGLDEEDPKQAARLMRKLYDATGLKLGSAMEEAIQRMEGGEDPDAIEEDLGGALEEEDPFGGAGGEAKPKPRSTRRGAPTVDDHLYDL